MGHIDHGKSTLLDYIRATKVAESEAGGITQHLSAYEFTHTTAAGEARRITFLDTPGHEAFQHLRSRGSDAADLAILVVAADDGVKPQTLEALRAIEGAGIPFLVAISKIDKNNANVERTKLSLVEHGVYLEGLGGSISYVPISSKTGEGIPLLLDLVVLTADVEELWYDPAAPARGVVIESRCDPKRGISAVLLLKEGTLHAGECVVAGAAYAPLRILEDFRGEPLTEATCSSPVLVVGFSTVPPVGSAFETVHTKKEAVAAAAHHEEVPAAITSTHEAEDEAVYLQPVIIKSDVVGSIDAIKHELRKLENATTRITIIHEGVGPVSESDVKHAGTNRSTLIIGFNVGVDLPADELAKRTGIEVARFSIIYDLADWCREAIEARRPAFHGEQEVGRAKVLTCFSHTKKMQTVGCRVASGTLSVHDRVKLFRGDDELGRGSIMSIKAGRSDVSSITAGNECGVQLALELESALTYGAELVAFTVC